MSVGAELAAARERLGLSREDVSQRTKISVERLLAIEQEDVQNLPPMVYLKGFVREYAAAVQLNPQEITERYLSGLDDPAGLVSAHPNEPQIIDADPTIIDRFPEEAPAAAPPRASAAPPPILAITPVPVVPPPAIHVAPAASSPPRAIKKILVEEYDELPPLEEKVPFAPAFAVDRPPERSFRGGRLALIVSAAMIAGFLVSANLGRIWPRAAARPQPAATTADAVNRDPQRAVATPPERASAAADEAVRASSETRVAPPASAPAASSSTRPSSSAPPSTRPPSPVPAAPAQVSPPAPVSSLPPPAAAAPSPPAPAPAPETPRPAPDAAAASAGLTGAWSLTTRIEATDYAAFNSLNLGYRIQLQQQGEQITGRGLKWMENGKVIPARSRTPIIIEGIRRGDRLELNFTEHGTARTTTGTFVMDVAADGTLRGQFASTSANSAGRSIARREPARN